MSRIIFALFVLMVLCIFVLSSSFAVEEKGKEKAKEKEVADDEENNAEKEEDVFGEDIERAIGDPARWDTLSKKIVPEIIKSNEDLGTMMRKISRAKCTVSATITSRVTNTTSSGKLTLSIDDANNDGVLSGSEIEIDIEDSGGFESAQAIKDFKGDLKIFLLSNIYNLFQIHHTKTKEVKAGYLLTLKPILDASQGNWVPQKLWEGKVTKDFQIIEATARFKDDVKAVIQYKHKKVGDKWVCVGYTLEATSDLAKVDCDAAYTFDIKKGMLFLNKIEIEKTIVLGGNVIGSSEVYTFSDWKVKEREKPLGIPEPANK